MRTAVIYIEGRVRANFLQERLDYLNSVEGGWNPTRLSDAVEELRRQRYPEDKFQNGSMRNTIVNALEDPTSTSIKTLSLMVIAMKGRSKVEWEITEELKIPRIETIDI
ncbi:MAG: hypothetical protein ACRCYP_01685 [Alphaproteobacteria bacterium]